MLDEKDFGKLIAIKWGVGGINEVGRMIAYCDHPQILIETISGEKIWWRADMSEVVANEEIVKKLFKANELNLK